MSERTVWIVFRWDRGRDAKEKNVDSVFAYEEPARARAEDVGGFVSEHTVRKDPYHQ